MRSLQIVPKRARALDMAMAINSSVMRPDNYIGSAYVIFGKDSQPSLIDYLSNCFKLDNLSLSSVSGGRTIENDYREAHFNVVGVNHPQSVFFQTTILWSLLTKNNETHQMQVTMELTYNNGTAYKKNSSTIRTNNTRSVKNANKAQRLSTEAHTQ